MVMGLLPLSFAKNLKKAESAIRIKVAVEELEQLKLNIGELKFKFISLCSKTELAMSVEIPIEEEFQLFLKARSLILKREGSEDQ